MFGYGLSERESRKSPFEERRFIDNQVKTALYTAKDINRSLVSDIEVGDIVIKRETDDDEGVRLRSRRFKVLRFYPNFVLLRNEHGYNTGVGYLELKNNYYKKGAKSKYALESL